MPGTSRAEARGRSLDWIETSVLQRIVSLSRRYVMVGLGAVPPFITQTVSLYSGCLACWHVQRRSINHPSISIFLNSIYSNFC